MNNTNGLILFPDDWSTTYYSVTSPNNATVAFNTNTISRTDWETYLEARGCVFLPAAGARNGTTVINLNSSGFYWSTTSYDNMSMGTEANYLSAIDSRSVSFLTT